MLPFSDTLGVESAATISPTMVGSSGRFLQDVDGRRYSTTARHVVLPTDEETVVSPAPSTPQAVFQLSPASELEMLENAQERCHRAEEEMAEWRGCASKGPS